MSFLAKLFRTSRSKRARRQPTSCSRVRLSLESLEVLVLPCTITWANPAGGAWENPSNWSPNRVPLTTDDVCINSGGGVNITHSSESTIQTLTLGSSRIEGSGQLTISGPFTWTGGTLSGAGRTIAAGGITISGDTNKFLQDSRILENTTTAVWTGNGEITMSSGAVVRNLPGARWEARSDSFFARAGGVLPTFENAGQFVKLNNTGESGIEVALTQMATGSVEVTTGTLFLSSNVTAVGSFTAAAGAELNFNSGTHILNLGSSITGAGRVAFSGGNSTLGGNFAVTGATRITGGQVTFGRDSSTVNGTLSRGVLGGSGLLSISGTFSWTGGEMRGLGQTLIEPTGSLTISGDDEKTLVRRTVTCLGDSSWSGAGSIEASEGASFNNAALFAVSSDASFRGQGAQPIVFENTGTVRRSGDGTTRFDVGVVFNSPEGAAVEVQAGGLTLGSGTGGGTFSAEAGATLTFNGGTHTLVETAQVFGDGAIAFQGATVTITGNYDSPGETRISGGSVLTLNGPNPRLRSGSMISSTLTGASDITIEPNELFSWNGGTITGSGIISILEGAVVSIGSVFDKLLDGRSLVNAGQMRWAGPLDLANGASWYNLATSLVESGNATLNHTTGDPSNFSTEGVVRTLDGGTTSFGVRITYTNAGRVEVLSGRHSILGTFTNFAKQTLLSGTFFIVGTLQFVNADLLTNEAEAVVILSGPASAIVNQNNANALVNFDTNHGYFGIENSRDFTTAAAFTNSGVLAVQAPSIFTATGLFNWIGGILSGNGTLQANGGLDLDSVDAVLLHGLTVNLAMLSTWIEGDLVAGEGARINIAATATLTIPIDANAYHSGSGDPVLIVNAGTVSRTDSPNSATLWDGIGFTNNGIVLVEIGTLALLGGLTKLDPGTGVLQDGTYTLRGLLQFPGAALGNNQAIITLIGIDAGIVDENFASAFLALATNAGQLTLQGGAALTSDAPTLINSGQITLTGAGTAFATSGSVVTFTATGRLTLQSGANFSSAAATFTNNGQITLSNAGTAFAVTGALVTGGAGSALTINNGTTLSAGTFTLTSSNATVAAGGTLTANEVTVQGGTLSAPGILTATVVIQGGTLTNSGTINGGVTQSGGTWNGTGTVHGGVLIQNGTFNASGTINGDVLFLGGRINIGGNAVGTLRVNGDWTQQGGILQVQLRDENSYDRLIISGTATLGGTLEVRLLNSFDPPLETPFDFLTFGGVGGEFATISPPQDMVFRIEFGETGAALVREE